PMAYADGVIYVPVINMITNWTPTSLDFSSVNFSTGKGELDAIDVNTGKKLWVNKLDSIDIGSAMVVNDLVFTATFDGTIYAFNRTDGAQLWTYKAPSAINGWPAVSGNTIVWPAGGGGGSFGNNATPLLLAFSLGGGNQTTPTPTATMVTVIPTTTATTMVMTTAPTSAATTTAGGSATVALTARNLAFDKSSITVPVGSTVTVTFNNMDSGVPHNFAVYTDATASSAVFKGTVVTGPTTTTYTFTAPSTPGTYFFRCDIHPTIMTGQFVVT
ncbi:MAG TPA: PQQ-binding-like beta-propeller repeat protein, partial [Methanoregulaceae archaeon]|nr:PQQ-binding-like beta-propeller repeat protein [Methanoregulaceae archaeon]